MEKDQKLGNQELGYEINRDFCPEGYWSERVGTAGVMGAMLSMWGFVGFTGITEKVMQANLKATGNYGAPLVTYIDTPGRLIGTMVATAAVAAGAFLFYKAVRWYREDRVFELTSEINQRVLEEGSEVSGDPKYQSEIQWLKERGVKIGLDSTHLN